MNQFANEDANSFPLAGSARVRRRVVAVSGDREYAESLRSHLAGEFDVLLAKNGGEAAAKAEAVPVDLIVVDLGSDIFGISALGRVRNLPSQPIVCALALPDAPPAQAQFDFDYVLARPSSGADLPDRIRFILAKARSTSSQD